MSTRMIMSIAFVASVVLGMLVYILQDSLRADGATQATIEKKAEAGVKLFGANCSQCHGPLGEGAIGPAINRTTWRGDNPANDNTATSDFLRKVLVRGQASPQPGINMPAWSKDYGGPFNDEQIEDVINFLMYGDWNEVLQWTSTPNYVAQIAPNEAMKSKYPNAAKDKTQQAALDKELADMKGLLQSKGCINCHAFGSAGSTLGPNLTEVGSRRTADWMLKWIEDPSKVPGTDRGPNVKPWFSQYSTPRTDFWPMNPTFMPTISMTQEERLKIVNYLADLKSPQVAVKPPANTTAQPNATPGK